MTKTTITTNGVYNVRLVKNNNVFKVTKAERRTEVNQYASCWTPTNSRNLARLLNKSNLVIK